MRLRKWTVLVAPIVWTCCSPSEAPEPDCSNDPSLCPVSETTANGVECNCTCQLPHIPLPGTKNAKYKGQISACLPPALNPSTASATQLRSLTVMSQGVFNQGVFKFCSEDVANWLSLTVKSQAARFEQLPPGLSCQPFRCSCETAGARLTETSCETQCEEQLCEKQTCEPILRQGGVLDFTSCGCSRTNACGLTAPGAGYGVCRVQRSIGELE